jgi:spore germination protein KA
MQFNKQKNPKAAEDKKQEKNPTQYKLDHSLDANVKLFKDIFNDNDTIVFRFFENRHDEKIKYCIIFIEVMADKTIINENIIKPVVQNPADVNISDIPGNLKSQVIYSNSIEKTQDVSELTAAVISGNTVLLAEGSAVGLIICTKGWKNRSIEEPQGERVISGPREGFIEALTVNLSMIRRKIETPELKMKLMTLGVQTHTKICVCYIEGIVNRKILGEVFKRLKGINIDGVLDRGY